MPTSSTTLSRAESLLQQLDEEGIVTVETDQGDRLYKLKAYGGSNSAPQESKN